MKARIESSEYERKKTVTIYSTEAPNEVASFAMELIRQHANVAGHEDGEDSQGRAKLRLQSAEELVERSFKIAELAYEAARTRGHMVSLPDLNEINADYDAKCVAKVKAEEEREAARAAARVA